MSGIEDRVKALEGRVAALEAAQASREAREIEDEERASQAELRASVRETSPRHYLLAADETDDSRRWMTEVDRAVNAGRRRDAGRNALPCRFCMSCYATARERDEHEVRCPLGSGWSA